MEKLFCVQCVSGDVAVALLLRSVCCLLMVLVVCAWGSGWEGTDIHKHRFIYMGGGGGLVRGKVNCWLLETWALGNSEPPNQGRRKGKQKQIDKLTHIPTGR